MPEFLDADAVLRELNISEADLTKLVSEGELVAFKDEVSQKLRFLSSDVLRLKESVKGKIYLTLEEVEKLCALEKTEIMDMVSEGKLQAFKDVKEPEVVKFKKSDVIKLLKKNGGSEGQAAVSVSAAPTPPVKTVKEEKQPLKTEKPRSEKPKEQKKVDKKREEVKIDKPTSESAVTTGEIELDIKEKSLTQGPPRQTDEIEVAPPPIQPQESKKESDDLFLEIKQEENLDLNVQPQEQEESLFKEESTSMEETDVDLGKLLDEGGTTTKEEEEKIEEEEVTVAPKLKKPSPKTEVPYFAQEGYEESTLEMVLLFLTLAIMIVIGVFVYDSFHILEKGKIVRPSDFTKEIGQQVASMLGAKDNKGNPLDLESALMEERKIGGNK